INHQIAPLPNRPQQRSRECVFQSEFAKTFDNPAIPLRVVSWPRDGREALVNVWHPHEVPAYVTVTILQTRQSEDHTRNCMSSGRVATVLARQAPGAIEQQVPAPCLAD